MQFERCIQKLGGSLALTIPSLVVKELNLQDEETLFVDVTSRWERGHKIKDVRITVEKIRE